MNIKHLLQACVFAGAAVIQEQAAAQDQPPRWVTVDSLMVRATPDAAGAVIGKLNRGAKLILKTPEQDNGYCYVDGDYKTGYVACKYLSAERIERSRAGANGIDAAQRWIAGNGVTVRAAPSRDAEVAGRLSLNAIVKLVGEASGSGYCEVQAASGLHGYTACSYLVTTPVVTSDLVNQSYVGQPPSAGADPARLFWLAPSWAALDSYVHFLKASHPEVPEQGPWPRDDNLERMKAHLALGIQGIRPNPYIDWAQMRQAAIDRAQAEGAIARFEKEGKAAPKELQQKRSVAVSTVIKLDNDGYRGIYIPDSLSDPYGQSNTPLMQALNFPAVQPSLFRSHLELAPGDTTAEDASGRFGIVFRQTTKPRPKAGAEGGDAAYSTGLYDMVSRTQSLVKAVHRVRLYRDGRLNVEASFLRSTDELLGDADGPECAGWIPGFRHGSADSALWKLIGYKDGRSPKENPNPPGSLYEFYTTLDLPRERASVNMTEASLDSKTTGFSSGTYLFYDLDGDGIPDLAVWEGKGTGPGAVELEATPNDHWYRLVLANIDGSWKVFGSDEFGYGCGC